MRDRGVCAKEQTAAPTIKSSPVDEKPAAPTSVPPTIPAPVVVTPAPNPVPPKEEAPSAAPPKVTAPTEEKRVPVETPPAPAPAPEARESDNSSALDGVVPQVLPKVPQTSRNNIHRKVSLTLKPQFSPRRTLTPVDPNPPA